MNVLTLERNSCILVNSSVNSMVKPSVPERIKKLYKDTEMSLRDIEKRLDGVIKHAQIRKYVNGISTDTQEATKRLLEPMLDEIEQEYNIVYED